MYRLTFTYWELGTYALHINKFMPPATTSIQWTHGFLLLIAAKLLIGLYPQHINIHSAETIREFKNSLPLSDAAVVMNCYCPCPSHQSSEMLLNLKCTYSMSVCTSRCYAAMTETETPAVAAVAAGSKPRWPDVWVRKVVRNVCMYVVFVVRIEIWIHAARYVHFEWYSAWKFIDISGVYVYICMYAYV